MDRILAQIRLLLLGAIVEQLAEVNQKLDQIGESMATKADVEAAIAQLKAVAQEEKAEVVAALTSAVEAAVAPLQQVITELQAQIANGVDLSSVLASIQEVTTDVEAIVEAAPSEPDE